MDPRPATTDPLAAAEAELAALESVSAEEQLGSYRRIHAALASALAGTTAEIPSPAAVPAPSGRPLGH